MEMLLRPHTNKNHKRTAPATAGGRFACQRGRQGQTIIETSILLMIIVFAFIAMQVYLKRGLQGRLRSNIDSLGEQYDPENTTSDYTSVHLTNSTTTTTTTETLGVDPYHMGLPVDNRLVTEVKTETYYDNTITNGYEHVEAP